ncbi:P-loop containing nucleoside triphosphate hydrolase protein [Obba rivulosa]|uniref:P-loop containing nucleoside triphosphate hydrolase protein n=1 Tax=Obba rivulosa TaxID=1052685 RepID=A0A8E2ARD9_9APHY|nr:P-loop containing nucleoside triphosphate hydrolase protein [Obba rivulosa]
MNRFLSLRSRSGQPKSHSRSVPGINPSSEKPGWPPAYEIDDTSSIQDGANNQQDASTAALVLPPAPLPPPVLKIKRVDHYYSNWYRAWRYRNTSAKATPEANNPYASQTNSAAPDPWQGFCFVVVRKMPRQVEKEHTPGAQPTFHIVVKSPYLRKACKEVMQHLTGISWTAEPLEIKPEHFITFLPRFKEYQKTLSGKRDRTEEENYVLSTVGVLIDYIHKDYAATLARLASLTSKGEISYDLLYALLVPRMILVTECPTTGEPRAVQLISATKAVSYYDLVCESVDAADPGLSTSNPNDGWGAPPDLDMQADVVERPFGRVQHRILLFPFADAVEISSLEAFPMQYHPAAAELKETLLRRGRKWLSLRGVHHMQYHAIATQSVSNNAPGLTGVGKKMIRYDVNSRVMVDRANFRRLNPMYSLPVIIAEPKNNALPNNYDDNCPSPMMSPPTQLNRHIPTMRSKPLPQQSAETELTEEELMLVSPIVYGFSFADKMWFELSVEKVQPIAWNDEAFANLVLPPGRKALLQSLVEAHHTDLGFDDFVQGKGHGLVINLYGPPGVGKTLSAEATSEHVRRPLYVVGAGDLGTSAGALDTALQRVFDIATGWKAIVLIDEADVFLEQRSLHDLERNAMVAVFLRHVEYYRGVLFMTTNRVQTFDEAFLSRIHVALHFRELTTAAKAQVWRAFLQKVGVAVGRDISEEHLAALAQREINGRQIKNATRTATSLAVSRREKLGFKHLVQTLDAMDEFTAEFAGMKA